MTPNHRKTWNAEKKRGDYASEVARVRKIIGQLEGVEKMILNHRPPLQLIQQTKAAFSALLALRHEILKRHIETCLTDGGKSETPEKISAEILTAIQMQSVR